jgi:cobalt-zinc-cadmium efflux system outer membrane protein
MRALKLKLRTVAVRSLLSSPVPRLLRREHRHVVEDRAVTEGVYERRSILLAELLRLKSLLFSLQNERLGLLGKIAESESSLRVLLRDTSGAPNIYIPSLDTGRLELFRPDSLQYADVAEAALTNRPDLGRRTAPVCGRKPTWSTRNPLPPPT